MTQGRPPNDEVAGEDRDLEEELHSGARSQPRSVEGERSPARATPRAAFGPASQAPPGQTDTDKTVKRPYPTAWGQTLPVGGAAMEEKTKVSRSVFSQTLPGEPSPAQQPQAPATRSARPQGDEQDFEPLRVPSQSPSPTPFQQSRGSAARTILIAGGAPAAPPPQAPAPKPAPRQAAPASPKATMPIGALEGAMPSTRAPAPAPASAAKRTVALGSAEHKAGAPAERVKSDANTSSRHEPVGPSRAPNVSEPLQLQLDARDVLEHGEVEAPGRASRAPLYAGIGIAILIAGALAGWIGSREKSAPVAEPTLRGDGVLAQDSPQAVAPAAAPPPAAPAPAAPVAAQSAAAQPTPAAAQPAAPQPQPQPAAAQPAAAKPEEAADEPAPETPKAVARPASKPAARAKKRPAGASAAAPGAPVSEDVLEARDALRSLDSEPVMKIQPSDEGGDFDAPAPEVPDTPDLPEPPPAPEE